MKLSTMRKLDYQVGRPLCFVLGWLLRLVGPLFRRSSRGGQRTVMFIELSEMGSTILAAPTVQRLIERNPDREPCFVILKKNVPSLRLIGLFEERNIYTIRDTSLIAMLVDVLRFPFFCRARGIDTTVDLELFSRISAVLAMISGAADRVGFDNYLAEGLYRGRDLTHRVNYNPYYHMSRNFLSLIDALDSESGELPQPKRVVPLPEQTARVPRSEPELDYLRAELSKDVDLARSPRLVLVNPDAGKLLPIRSWPVEKFAELTRRLIAEDEDVVVVIVGIPDAKDCADAIRAAVPDPRVVDFVGKTRTLADLVQLFHLSELLITNDSGPAHFASLTQLRTVTLFGPETPRLYGPLGERSINLFKGLACSPCLTAFNHRNSPCTDNQCLKQIEVEEVLGAARTLLADRAAERAGAGA